MQQQRLCSQPKRSFDEGSFSSSIYIQFESASICFKIFFNRFSRSSYVIISTIFLCCLFIISKSKSCSFVNPLLLPKSKIPCGFTTLISNPAGRSPAILSRIFLHAPLLHDLKCIHTSLSELSPLLNLFQPHNYFYIPWMKQLFGY